MKMGFVKYDQDGFVGVITINRPEALNALNTEVIQDLDAVSWRHFRSRRSLLSMVLRWAVEMSLQ